jgi:hypothetical protein
MIFSQATKPKSADPGAAAPVAPDAPSTTPAKPRLLVAARSPVVPEDVASPANMPTASRSIWSNVEQLDQADGAEGIGGTHNETLPPAQICIFCGNALLWKDGYSKIHCYGCEPPPRLCLVKFFYWLANFGREPEKIEPEWERVPPRGTRTKFAITKNDRDTVSNVDSV